MLQFQLVLTSELLSFSFPVYRHIIGDSGEGTTEQIHSRPSRGGHQRHAQIPAICGQSVCDPQCGDGFFKKEKV